MTLRFFDGTAPEGDTNEILMHDQNDPLDEQIRALLEAHYSQEHEKATFTILYDDEGDEEFIRLVTTGIDTFATTKSEPARMPIQVFIEGRPGMAQKLSNYCAPC